MNKLKIIATAASLIMCTGIFSACGDSDKIDNSQKETTEITEQTVDKADDSVVISSADSNCSSEGSQNEVPSDITPAMWLVTSPEGNTMVCLGSMHALTKDDYPLPAEITNAFNNADVLAVECDVTGKDNMINQLALLKSAILTGNDTAANHMSEEAYEILSERFAEFNISLDSFKKYKPWFLQNTYESFVLMSSGLNAELGIDTWLLDQAHSSGKEIFEVESYDFQIDLLTNMSDETYDLMFRALEGETKARQIQSLNELYEAWKTGNVEKIDSMNSDVDYGEMTKEDIKIYKQYCYDMYNNRNKAMASAVETLLDEGKNVFYVVGAAHFVGETGIIRLLEADGYVCERIEYK
ncbi:MAG: TraB/GumN family protein [Ruminococcus sp.]|nr:TraB/GumN family protein [Ruminococcus sp.]